MILTILVKGYDTMSLYWAFYGKKLFESEHDSFIAWC